MVRKAEDRIAKWKKKLSGDARKQAYDAQKTIMVKKEKAATWDLVRIEQQVKRIIGNVPTYLQHFYMAFAKEIYSKQKKYKYQTLVNELRILDDKWYKRGLSASLLAEIKDFYVPIYLLPEVCRFDVGRFDVNTFG